MLYRNAELYNVAETEETGDGVRLCRIPSEVRRALNGTAENSAYYGCGTEIRFVLGGGKAALRIRRDRAEGLNGTGIAEVYYGSFQASYLVSPCFITEAGTDLVIPKPENLSLLKELSGREGMPYDPELVRVLLPYDAGNVLVSLKGDVRPPGPGMAPAKRVLAYGSSITHGGSAVRPSGSFAARTARELRADPINLGFAGGARMEPEMARYIAGRGDWDLAVLELGTNVLADWDAGTFRDRVGPFISLIALAHPDQWIFCTDLFLNGAARAAEEKRELFSRIVSQTVRRIDLPKLVYLPGSRLLTRWQGLSADLLHPSEDGFGEIAGKLTGRIRRALQAGALREGARPGG